MNVDTPTPNPPKPPPTPYVPKTPNQNAICTGIQKKVVKVKVWMGKAIKTYKTHRFSVWGMYFQTDLWWPMYCINGHKSNDNFLVTEDVRLARWILAEESPLCWAECASAKWTLKFRCWQDIDLTWKQEKLGCNKSRDFWCPTCGCVQTHTHTTVKLEICVVYPITINWVCRMYIHYIYSHHFTSIYLV